MTVEGRVWVAKSWLWFPFVITEEEERGDRRTGGRHQRRRETVFLSLGGVAALFDQP